MARVAIFGPRQLFMVRVSQRRRLRVCLCVLSAVQLTRRNILLLQICLVGQRQCVNDFRVLLIASCVTLVSRHTNPYCILLPIAGPGIKGCMDYGEMCRF
jgi:hypothetical protein